MKCDNCHAEIESGEQREHLGRILCEDCYIDAVAIVKTCDPWAVHSAKNYEKYSGKEVELNPIQLKILDLLKKEGATQPPVLLERIGNGLQLKDLEREFAALRHMEKVRAEKLGRKILWRLW